MTLKWILCGEPLFLAPSYEIGGKAVNLRKLQSQGFPVPDFAVIPHSVVEVLKSGSWPEEFVDELKNFAGGKFCMSVRSSVSDEDGAKNSFAGMMTSVLNVRDFQSLIDAIQAVMKSYEGELVQQYRRVQGVAANKFGAGIILQKMIQAEVSGVLFTANPTTGNRDQMCLSASFGLGEGVVSGTVDCDEWDYDWKRDQETSARISKKEIHLVGKSAKSGVEQVTVAPALQSQSSLTTEQRRMLYKTGLKISKTYSWPQDIEWCLAEGQLFILQSRPITAKSLLNSWDEQYLHLNNANIQESFCGLTLPLTFSFATEAYRRAYNQSLKLMSFSTEQVLKHDLRHQRMLAVVQGQVYYNIQSWYEGLLVLPSFGRNKADMEKMMGLENPLDLVQDQTLGFSEKIKQLPQMVKLVSRLAIKFAGIQKRVRLFLSDFEEKYQNFQRDSLFLKTEQELLAAIHHYKTVFLENWSTPILNDFYVMMNNGKVMRVLEKTGQQGKYSELLMGEKLESTEPTKRLLRLSRKIHDRPFGKTLLADTESLDSLKNALLVLAPDLAEELETYLVRYGDRVPGELKLETFSSFQDGTFVLECLKHSSLSSGPDTLEATEMQLRTRAEAEVFAAIRQKLGILKLLEFQSSLKKLRFGIVAREAMRMHRTRSFGVFRALYSEIGLRWQQRQILENDRDIFYLTETEIEDFFYGKSFLHDLKPVVALRKEGARKYHDVSLPGALKLTRPPQDVLTPLVDSEILSTSSDRTGIGCFPGKIRAPVCRMPEMDAQKNVEGHILATVRTDPGWAPLFPRIKGLLVERGSRLSHSAIVARELGLPTIVNLPNLMNWIVDGEIVTINGETGSVRKEYGVQRNDNVASVTAKD